MDDSDRVGEGELEGLLRAYAGARLSPDQWASIRMRAAVLEHGHGTSAASARRISWLRVLRPATLVGLIAILAVGTGATAALAASPGGPLYDARLWVETTVLNLSGGTAQLRVDQMDERIDEITNAVDDGNTNAADAAGNAYGAEVSAAAQAAQNRADLQALRAAIANHLAHLQAMAHSSSKAQANLDRLIAKDIAALATIDSRLAALPSSSPTP
ncbi:MAG TPA: hypothetical protein VJ506_08930 [Candidatus Limnocylindrales bacterium]|nr:hypothetical protein [Candidatus Limnocylindrales bacterium]